MSDIILNTRASALPIVTSSGHMSRALDFFRKDSIYFGYGKTDEWADENLPDAPNPEQSELFTPLGYKKVQRKQLVVPDPNGSVVYANTTWRPVTESEAIAEKCRWVYIETTLNWDELTLGTYRQIGILTDLVPVTGKISLALLPDEVQNPGLLTVIYNRTKVVRQLDQKDQFSIILEF